MKLNFLLKSSLLILVMLIGNPINAQELDHVQGEILVKLWPSESQTVKSWISKFETINGRNSEISYNQEVSAAMDIHSVTFNANEIADDEMLQLMQRDNKVQAVQFNHFVKLRSTIPDDPQFVSQWQYINTGQGGGTVGADIDMDLAWDIATGGLTADGDTIVSCIIDDGINLNHPDIAANLWKNHAEIPNNGIDDDNNGFVDDFHGWDTGSDSDNVGTGGGHGTPVTGIVGAVGNNGVGVAGVNWDVKLMIVRGGTGVESEVLEAYSYPYVARKKYNETNGAEGAFVVSTNASWGIDQGQPANSPLWCAFYDSLGVQGIISCGATANANFNIDVVGDLPTACSSEYLISVTNMNRDDVKVTGAGYGLTTIDLGAFGQGTWTTTLNNYGGFGGTSGATPHVTGALALLYSAPCPTLISIAKNDPAEAARMVRDFILEGVDPNASLDGITVTGGRMNVATSINNLMNNCGPCPPPSSLALSDLIDISGLFSWNNNDSIVSNNLRYRTSASTDWIVTENVASPYSLSGLLACTNYEAQIVGICASDTSYSSSIEFKTDGCCENPSTFYLNNVQNDSVTANWSSVLAANSYTVRISEAGMNNWNDTTVTELNFTFGSLMDCTDYEVQIKVNCGNGLEEDFSESKLFTTKGCGACTDFTYCPGVQLSTEDEWIESVAIGSLTNTSGDNSGYGNFTDGGATATFSSFGYYDITLTPGYSGNNFNEGWSIWIDLNHDGDFDDAEENVFVSSQISNEPTTATILIPGSATPGITRMRVSMEYDGNPGNPCVGTSGFGETEDYCITIELGTPSCPEPENLSANNITEVSADLSWDEVLGADDYMVRYKEVSASSFTELAAMNNMFELTGLTESTAYEFQVRSNCGNILESEYSGSFTFTTETASSVNAIRDLEQLDIYPNPFEDHLVVELNFTNQQSNIQLKLVDQLGRQVQQIQLDNVAVGVQKITIPTGALSSGIYFINIIDESGNTGSKRVVKTGL